MGRHESFDNATPFAAEMLAGTILGCGLGAPNAKIDNEQAASNDGGFGLDPILAEIERHRAAYAEWDRLSRVCGDMLPSEPGYKEAVAAAKEPGQREIEAFDALMAVRPTTFDGLHRLIEYLPTATRQTAVDTQDGEEQRALEAIRDGLRGLAGADRLQPVPSAGEVSFDLAHACDQAIVAWGLSNNADTDEDSDAQLAIYDGVFRRAIDEPSRSLADLQGKARLLLHDLLEHEEGTLPDFDEATLYDDDRLARVLLREIIALGSTASVDPTGRDTALLALIPTLLPMLDEMDLAFAATHPLYEASQAALGGAPDWEVVGRKAAEEWDRKWLSSPGYLAYVKAREPADALDNAIETMVAAHMGVPAQTLDGLLLKQRIGRTAGQYENDAADDLDKLLTARLAAGLFGATPAQAPISPDADLYQVLANHRTAHRRHDEAVNPADASWVRQHGGDASEAAMALAAEARDAASEAADQAWHAVFRVRPQTSGGFLAFLRHVGEWFDEYDGMQDGPDVLGALIGAFETLHLTGSMPAVAEAPAVAQEALALIAEIEREWRSMPLPQRRPTTAPRRRRSGTPLASDVLRF